MMLSDSSGRFGFSVAPPPKKNMCVVCPLPVRGFDPTEVAVVCQILLESGVDVTFALPDSAPEGSTPSADPIMMDGRGLYLKWSMRADINGRAAYKTLSTSAAFRQPTRYSALLPASFNGLFLPGRI